MIREEGAGILAWRAPTRSTEPSSSCTPDGWNGIPEDGIPPCALSLLVSCIAPITSGANTTKNIMNATHQHAPAAGDIHLFLNDVATSCSATPDINDFGQAELEKARAFHRSLPGYAPTPLLSLRALACRLGLGGIYVKDESKRFGLKAFKVLGCAYAMGRLIVDRLGQNIEACPFAVMTGDAARARLGEIVFATATDGNHGRAVAWMARQLGHKAVVYLPQGASPARLTAIRAEGAEAEIVDMNYDNAVRMTAHRAAERGWLLVQDTAWNGYETTPRRIMQGYGTLMLESLQQLGETTSIRMPTHIFVQAGVGSLAGAVQGCIAARQNSYITARQNTAAPPRTIVVEASAADCLYRSARAGKGTSVAVSGELATIMAGLACGEANPLAWEILRDHAAAFASCPDDVAARGMRIYGHPLGNDPRIRSGESGAVTLGLLSLLMQSPRLAAERTALGLNETSHVLLINTEGDTDPERFLDIVWDGDIPSIKWKGNDKSC